MPEHLKKGLGFYWSLTKGSTRPTIKMTGIAPRQYAKSYCCDFAGTDPLPPKGAGGFVLMNNQEAGPCSGASHKPLRPEGTGGFSLYGGDEF